MSEPGGTTVGRGDVRTPDPLIGLYKTGQLKRSGLVTRRCTLDQINEGYADMHAGRKIRGVIERPRWRKGYQLIW